MSTTPPLRRAVRLAAVGDLLLAPDPTGTPYLRDPDLLGPEVRGVLSGCDVVFGNLECGLAGDGPCVPTEPRVMAGPDLVRAVKAAGFSVVSLANNHVFDGLEAGFRDLRSLLDEIGLPHFGAGMNLDEAAAPAILDASGLRVALLGAVDERSRPYRFATATQAGVAPLDTVRLVRQIGELRAHVHHVLVSIHWGEERFSIPSPAQIDLARALVEAGASMVLGHHPHVLQGLEIRSGAPIAYSLGNFIADDVHFSDGDVMRWNRAERTGCILLAELRETGIGDVRQVPTFDPGRAVQLDGSGFGQRRIDNTRQAIARGVTAARYRREHLWVKTIRPAFDHLRWSRLKRIRWKHVRSAFREIWQAGRAR